MYLDPTKFVVWAITLFVTVSLSFFLALSANLPTGLYILLVLISF